METLKETRTALTAFVDRLPDLLVRLIFAILVLVIGIIVLRLGRRLIRRISDNYIRKHPRYNRNGEPAERQISGQKTARDLAISIFNYVLYFTIAMATMSTLGVDVTSLLAVAGVSGIAIGFGCQTLVKDFLSGLFLWTDGYIKVGDIITAGSFTGTVENVALRTTTLRGTNGNIMVIPNGEIRAITNMTRDYRCALVDITVAHGQDYAAVIDLLRNAMQDLDKKLDYIDEAPAVLGIIASDGRAATVRIESKCDIADCWTLEREIRLIALTEMQKAGFKP